jgi:hypothetical protein
LQTSTAAYETEKDTEEQKKATLGTRLVQFMGGAVDAANKTKAIKDYYEQLDKLSKGSISQGVSCDARISYSSHFA